MTSLSSRSIRAARSPQPVRSAAAGERQGTVVQGSFKGGQDSRTRCHCDVLTVEIEHVNCDVLDELVAEEARATLTGGDSNYSGQVHAKAAFCEHGVALGQFMDAQTQQAWRPSERSWATRMLQARKGASTARGMLSSKVRTWALCLLSGNVASSGDATPRSGAHMSKSWLSWSCALLRVNACRTQSSSSPHETMCATRPTVLRGCRRNNAHSPRRSHRMP